MRKNNFKFRESKVKNLNFLRVFVSRSFVLHSCVLPTSSSIVQQQPRLVTMASANGPSKLHHVFVYGTLKKGEPNHDCIVNSQTIGRFCKYVSLARTCQRWPLIIASRFNVPFLLHNKGAGHRVFGEVYAVDDEMLETFDKLENHPILHKRIECDVKLLRLRDIGPEPEIVKCWIYFLERYKDKLLDLPQYQDYTTYGTHGLIYNFREALMYPEDIYKIGCIL